MVCEESVTKNNTVETDICKGNSFSNDFSNKKIYKTSHYDDKAIDTEDNDQPPKINDDSDENRKINVDLNIVNIIDKKEEESLGNEATDGINTVVQENSDAIKEIATIRLNDESNSTNSATGIKANNETGVLEKTPDKNTLENEQKYKINKNDEQNNVIEACNDDFVENTNYQNSNINFDSQILSKDDIIKDLCGKCQNVKLNNVCLCTSSTVYNKLNVLNKNLNKFDSKNVSDNDSPASVDLSSAIALINR